MDVIRENRLIASILGGLVVISLLVILLNGDGSIEPAFPLASTAPAAATSAPESARSPNSVSDRPDISPLSCGSLLPQEAIDEGLAVWDRPPGQQGSFRYARGETCVEQIDGDEGVFVGIEPGTPADFQPGAELLGVGGEPVAGVGDGALWFGGEQAEGEGDQGKLSVRQTASVGMLHFRIVLGRPDLESAEQIGVAKELALSALPRFPGVVLQPPEAAAPNPDFAAAFDEEAVDRSGVSFVDNLLAKEESGEWTRGEGLLATLRLFAGEADGADVLRQPDVLRREETGVLQMAADYLESDGREVGTAAEVARLFDLLVYTNEELEAMAGIEPATSVRTSDTIRSSVEAIAHGTTLQEVGLCGNFFHGAVAPGVGTCLEWRPANVPGDLEDDKYRVFIPSPDLPQGGWTEDHYDLALGALEFSARWFEDHGQMPAVNVVFSVSPGSPTLAHAYSVFGKPCGVILYRSLQAETPGDFQQVVAHELAHCFQTETFPDQDFYAVTKWREEGAAEYFSNRVYPQNNIEWDMFGENQSLKAGTTVFDLSYANGLFFQYLEQEIGLNGVFAVIMSMPTSGGRSEQEANLAKYPGMKEIYQRYAEAMIDGKIADTGGGNVDFKLTYPTVTVTGSDRATASFKPFGVGRIRIVVNECMRAHFDVEWDPAEHSARPEASMSWGSLPGTIPAGSGDAHDRVIVATSREEAEVEIKVTDVDDDPECEEDESPPFPDPCDLPCPPSEYYWRAFGVAPE